MERLSEELRYCLEGNGCGKCEYAEEKTVLSRRGLLQAAYEKIKHYEDLEKQGLLLKLPCKVGDTVYWVNDWFYNNKIGFRHEWHISEMKVRKFVFDDISFVRFTNEICIDIKEFGKYIFLTQAEAEEALEKMAADRRA